MAWNTAPTLTLTSVTSINVAWQSGTPSGISFAELRMQAYRNGAYYDEWYEVTSAAGNHTFTGLPSGSSWTFRKLIYDYDSIAYYGTMSASMATPSVPSAPSAPSLSFAAPHTITESWSAPSNGGSAILEYQAQYGTDPAQVGFTDAPSAGTGLSIVLSSYLVINATFYFRVRARNAVGWGAWSGNSSYHIPNVPSTPAAPTLVYAPPSTITATYVAPYNGGATISQYEVQYATTSNFASPTAVSSGTALSKALTGLSPGLTYYIRVRALNSQGWSSYSASSNQFTYAGPRIRVAGIYQSTVCYVRSGGIWKVAIPYVKLAGIWRDGGG